jgi:ATP-dependent DNA ligase
MEAKEVARVPAGGDWQYEPKWDGFRCIAFKNGANVILQSKSGQPLERYFPEVVEHVKAIRVARVVLDGELVVPVEGGKLSFDDLLQRIHPAESRVKRLAAMTPAVYVVFDVLAEATRVLTDMPLSERRKRLEQFMKKQDPLGITLSPATRKLAQAEQWLSGAGGDLDGVIAKRADAAYASGERTAVVKIKRRRTVDCVVGGFRYGSKTRVVGSLLLGLYDADGLLNHVGFTSSIAAADKAAVTQKLEALAGGKGFTGRAPGGPSRWSTERSAEWVPLKPSLVVEVEYDHFNQDRFRHGTKFLRWRPDKAPRQCTFEQLANAAPSPALPRPARALRGRTRRTPAARRP